MAASTNVNIATIDRLVVYVSLIPPSFLPPVCTKVKANPGTELITAELDVAVQTTITVKICPFIK